MSRADDVANLFQRFGASSDVYLETDNSLDYQESSVSSTPSVALQRATSQPSIEQPCAEQSAQNNAPAPDSITPDKTRRIAADTLAKLLAEAVQARQAEAQARNNEALAQSMGKEQLSRTPAHVIAVVSAKGGVGKSTLSAALTSLVKVPGGQTLAIDLDPQDALQHHLNASPDVAGLGGPASAARTGVPCC